MRTIAVERGTLSAFDSALRHAVWLDETKQSDMRKRVSTQESNRHKFEPVPGSYVTVQKLDFIREYL